MEKEVRNFLKEGLWIALYLGKDLKKQKQKTFTCFMLNPNDISWLGWAGWEKGDLWYLR